MKLKDNSKIFIIDDDPFWAGMLTQMLENLGYTNIDTFDNGHDALSNLVLNPQLVFLDYQMEDLNGLEVLQKVKTTNENIGVVFCTAHEDLSVAVDAMKYGSFDYLLKENATKKEVFSIIENMIENQLFADKIF